VAFGVLLGASGPVVGSAQDQSVEDARRQREETLDEKARAAEQLDVLRAQEGQVRTALSDLDAALALQDAQIATATAELATAQARLEGARRLVVETTEREAQLRATSADGAVQAYIGAAGERTARIWLQAADVNEVARREQLLDVVNGNLDAHLDQLRLVAEARKRAEQGASDAADDAARLQAELHAAQAELAERRDAQGRLEDALRASIDDYRVRADRLENRLEQYRPGDKVTLLVARREQLLRLELTLGTEPARAWRLEVNPSASEAQQSGRGRWLNPGRA